MNQQCWSLQYEKVTAIDIYLGGANCRKGSHWILLSRGMILLILLGLNANIILSRGIILLGLNVHITLGVMWRVN